MVNGTYPIAALMQPSRRAAVGLAEREFTDERPSHYRYRRSRCRQCVFRGSEKRCPAVPCAGKDRRRHDGARRKCNDYAGYIHARDDGA